MAATKTARDVQPSNPFIKQLASSNRTTRDRALSSLRTYLSTPRSKILSNLDLQKLHKGLFYCMFMSDKPRNQQNLARDLASLVDVLSSFNEKLSFIQAFWQIMGREWGNIDYLRMDKYLYLVRCYVKKGFEVLEEAKWDEDNVEAYSEVMQGEGGPLSARDSKVSNGIRLHVLDIWVDELEKVDGQERRAPIEKVMEPVRRLTSEAFAKSVKQRAKESVEDERLVDGAAWTEEEHAESEDEDMEDAEAGDEVQEDTMQSAPANAETSRSKEPSQKKRRDKNK